MSKPRWPLHVIALTALLVLGGLFLIGVVGMEIQHVQVSGPD